MGFGEKAFIYAVLHQSFKSHHHLRSSNIIPRICCINSLFPAITHYQFIEDLSRITKPGTHFLIQTDSGSYAEFRDVYPEVAAEIEEIVRLKKPFRLYYLRNDPPFSPEFLTAFRSYIQQRNQ